MVPRFCSLTATQAVGLLKNNTITVEEYASSLLDRIEERDSIVKAWAYLDNHFVLLVPTSLVRRCVLISASDPAFVLDQARNLDQIPTTKGGRCMDWQ